MVVQVLVRAGLALLLIPCVALLFGLWHLMSTSHYGDIPPPDIAFLTSDGHFMIGGQHVTVPMIALRGPDRAFSLSRDKPQKSRKQILLEQAIDPGHPMPVDSLDLQIEQYESRDRYGASKEICGPMTRAWTQVVCPGRQTGLLKRLPVHFGLVARARVDLLKHRSFAGGNQTQYEQLMPLPETGAVKVGCTKGTRWCSAVVEPLPGLLAVWLVWAKDGASVDEVAERQGAAIVQFVRRGLSPLEDRTLATTE